MATRPAPVLVRPATEDDIPALLQLMRGLAKFEEYIDHFAVTEATLREQGFRKSPPDFTALVAPSDGALVGMLVYYIIPFTFRARPTLVVKELFVAAEGRGRRIGDALMRAAARAARDRGCATIKWQVARWNLDAMRFYERLGAVADPVWVDYGLSEAAIVKLAAGDPP